MKKDGKAGSKPERKLASLLPKVNVPEHHHSPPGPLLASSAPPQEATHPTDASLLKPSQQTAW